MRHTLFLLLLILCFGAVSCRTNNPNPASETSQYRPPFVSRNGLTFQLTSVERNSETVKIGLRAINGTNDRILLGERADAPVLRDDLGSEYPSKDEIIELLPRTVNDLEIEFAAALPASAKMVSVTTNSKSETSVSPRITLENIPAANGKAVFDQSAAAPSIGLGDVSVNHRNGTSVTLNQINFSENTIDIEFSAVNGSEFENKFSTRPENAFLEDDRANRYFLIPQSGDEIALAQNQKMSGTLRFAGKLAPDATKMSFHLNERTGGDNENARAPKIVIGNIIVK